MLEQVSRIFSFVHQRSDEDSVNRLISFYSIIILCLSVLLVSAKQYVGSPLQCWVPAHFTGAMEQYTENYCWVENTWFYPYSTARMPWLPQRREDAQISYYQWVPFLLLAQMFLCFLPPRMWGYLNGCSGHDPKSVMKAARACRSLTDPQSHDNTIKQIVEHLYKPRDVKLDSLSSALRRNFDRYAILIAYLILKLLYFAVIFAQFFVMMEFLDIANPFFGWKMYEDLRNNVDWEETGVFPRVTMCDFEVKVMGNLHRYTVQCVLLINMFNEKIFMFLWFWFAILMFIFVGSICYWAAFLCPCWQRAFVSKHLGAVRHLPDSSLNPSQVDCFVDRFLGPDVVFLLVLLKEHAGSIVLSEILLLLWKKFQSMPQLMQNGIGATRIQVHPADEKPPKTPPKKPSSLNLQKYNSTIGNNDDDEFVEILDEMTEESRQMDQKHEETFGKYPSLLPLTATSPPPQYNGHQLLDAKPSLDEKEELVSDETSPSAPLLTTDEQKEEHKGAHREHHPAIVPFQRDRKTNNNSYNDLPMNDRHSDPGRGGGGISPATALMVPFLLNKTGMLSKPAHQGRSISSVGSGYSRLDSSANTVAANRSRPTGGVPMAAKYSAPSKKASGTFSYSANKNKR